MSLFVKTFGFPIHLNVFTKETYRCNAHLYKIQNKRESNIVTLKLE